MNKSDKIIDEIVQICNRLNIDTELDRVLQIQDDDLPKIVVRTGQEYLDPVDSATIKNFHLRWTIGISVEVYMIGDNPQVIKTELNKIWNDFRTDFFQPGSIVLEYVAHGTFPELSRVVESPSSNPKISGQIFDISITFFA